ncbi:MAG: sugar transferase [Nitrospirae bacterium]|nr:sugar transferase [Nitrospirota bacterium]
MKNNATNTCCGIKKAIIIAGGVDASLAAMSKYYTPWLLPVLNEPLMGFTLDYLKRNGIREIALSLSPNDEMPNRLLEGNGANYYEHVEDKHRGSAGVIKDVESFIQNEPFLVICSNLFIGDINLEVLVRDHFRRNSLATVGLSRLGNNAFDEEYLVSEDGRISDFRLDYSSFNKSRWKACGLYIFDPEVLNYIDGNRYMDIKEQLIPLLLKESRNVFAGEISGYHRCVRNTSDYVSTNMEVLAGNSYARYLGDKEEVADGVWIGRGTTVSPHAWLFGPVILGDGCTVDRNAHIVGPAVIGNDCYLSEDVLVHESILWDSIALPAGSKVEFSVIGNDKSIRSRHHIKNMVVLNGLGPQAENLMPVNYSMKRAVDLPAILSRHVIGKFLYAFTKRALDVVISLTSILLLLPFFVIIAVLVKSNSKGPVFFIQKRCGLHGKLFGMIKFRTMVENAENIHKELLSKNEMDGPMFKMSRDPRVTSVGRILRETSLDEMPQLFNVLKGEMSLVGPRPLITEEMKFSSTWRDTRLRVKPGITGLWQVEGRSESPFHDWIKYDTYYVKNQSFLLDLKILFKTITVVMKKVGAY